MMRPPPTAEVLLRSIGARTSFCEPLLGDLAEGFAVRVERDGPDSARRWYYREAIRATPHLLGDWRRSLRGPDIRHLAGVVLTSYVFALMIVFLGATLTRITAGALGFSPQLRPGPFSRVELLVLWLPLEITCTVLGGYIAAWLDERAPLASAIALCHMVCDLGSRWRNNPWQRRTCLVLGVRGGDTGVGSDRRRCASSACAAQSHDQRSSADLIAPRRCGWSPLQHP